MAIVTKVTKTDAVAFDDIKSWFNEHMHVDAIDLEDQKPYEVYENARWAGIFQLTSKGAQKFFEKAKPKSITDIAALTSIYRPGPLAANVDKLYLEAKAGNFYDWGDQRINELLSKTHGLLIFQEQVMLLAEKCAGFPKQQCDDVRRAIMKRSISGGEAAKNAAQGIRESFVQGCIKNGYSERIANDLYDKILYFAGYGFNCLSGDTLVETKERGNVYIKDVIPGEHVNSQFGFVKVLNQIDSGKQKTYIVTTKTGKSIRCTLKHRLMTPNGLMSLKDIISTSEKRLIIKPNDGV